MASCSDSKRKSFFQSLLMWRRSQSNIAKILIALPRSKKHNLIRADCLIHVTLVTSVSLSAISQERLSHYGKSVISGVERGNEKSPFVPPFHSPLSFFFSSCLLVPQSEYILAVITKSNCTLELSHLPNCLSKRCNGGWWVWWTVRREYVRRLRPKACACACVRASQDMHYCPLICLFFIHVTVCLIWKCQDAWSNSILTQ